MRARAYSRVVRALVLAVVAACGVRTPAPVDVGALLAKRGPIEAHRDLVVRVLADGKDVQARLALAELDERIGKPGEAIEELVVVEHLGGPFGTRWHDGDRARLGRLLAARGKLRLARGAASALDDLERARTLGAAVAERDLLAAKIARAVVRLRHVDGEERAAARTVLAGLVGEEPAWTGARAHATPEQRAQFGAWAWTIGARREAYEQLAAWHDATTRPRDPALETAYLRALAWWAPPEREPPDETTDAIRCYFASAGCAPPAEPHSALELAAPADAEPRAWAATRYALARASAPAEDVYAIARAFEREPAVADRLARDVVAASVDEAAGHAAVGALFDALGDPSRARTAWQAAVDASAEPAFVRGLAEATARAGDAPAAIVFATTAAAAWGDPAVVWLAVARDLIDANLPVDALVAARSAIELGDAETLPAAYDLAIAASRALGRDTQADAFAALRVKLAPAAPDLVTTLAAELAKLPADDPRRLGDTGKLVELAGSPDPALGLAAVRALKQ